jgi:signal transduction protein with GAF and PtsI domain
VLEAVAMRGAVARRIESDGELALLQQVVDAAALLFESEASSIALFERDPDRLEFRVAAGAQGAGVVGLSVSPTQGIAGYVFSTGQPIALSDVASDPRFDQATARLTGYLPRSIAAVPLLAREGPIGVLQVLDKRTTPTFSLRDLDLMGAFAGLAANAVEANRLQRDMVWLMRSVIGQLGPDAEPSDIELLVGEATRALDTGADAPFWRLVDLLARMRGLDERDIAIVSDILEVLGRHATPASR